MMTLEEIIETVGIEPYHQEKAGVIYLADCREILPKIKEVNFSLILSDPPYGGGLAVDYADRFKTHAGKWWNKSDRNGQARHKPIVGANEPFDPTPILALKAEAKILWGANWYCSRLPDSGGWWVWDKRNGKRDVSKADWPMSEAELAWTNIGKGVRIFRHTWFGLIRDSERDNFCHPTQKPVVLMKWCIEKSKAAGIVFDPYLGSGTTAVACKEMGRQFVGIEIEESYAAIAKKRLRQGVLQF